MKILESLEPVLEQSTHVSVNEDKISEFTTNFDRARLANWLSVSPFNLNQLNEEEKLSYLFALDSISFSYWGTPKWTVEYLGKKCDGAKAMMACLGSAIESGIKFNPTYFANIGRKDLENILRGNIEIPLLDERLRNLNEVGEITKIRFKGDFRYVVDKARNDASQLVDLLVKNFPSFEDTSKYKGRKVEFNKRAQLLTADISYSFESLKNRDRLTACADYKLPQALRRYKILQYCDKLQERIRRGEEIPAGSKEEVEIRAHTIYTVELIKKKLISVTSNQVNDYLWLEGQVKYQTDEPYHLTRTTAY